MRSSAVITLPPRESFESVLDRHLPLRQRARLRDLRYCFYAMVVGEFEQRPPTWWRRRRLIRFARKLGLEHFDAVLLVAGAEYRCGFGLAPHAVPTAREGAAAPAAGHECEGSVGGAASGEPSDSIAVPRDLAPPRAAASPYVAMPRRILQWLFD